MLAKLDIKKFCERTKHTLFDEIRLITCSQGFIDHQSYGVKSPGSTKILILGICGLKQVLIVLLFLAPLCQIFKYSKKLVISTK